MKKLLLLYVALSSVWIGSEARSKYVSEEEDNPYEFGFTIDGQQHRHEKKDANGVIQGEFGFITADGIYHVTVYATDEDGNFKILSMRNVRVSGPLDEPNAKLPDTSQFSKGQTHQPAPAPNPLSINTSPAPVQAVAVTESNRFTTQSTIKPACAGCGYVTHKTPLVNKLDFQTDAVHNPRPGSVIFGPKPQGQHLGHNQGSTQLQNQGLKQGSNLGPNQGSGLNAPPGANAPFVSNSNQGQFESAASPDSDPGNYYGQNNNQNYPQNNPGQGQGQNDYPGTSPNQDHQNYPQIAGPQDNYNNPAKEPTYPQHPNTQQSNPENPFLNPLSINGPGGITVANGQITIPDNPPITIQDKFPGMVDGLPPGISQGDITDLLYKFNYTVAFHGHYEKGYKNGAKVGGYFVNDRDGVSRIVTYVADENGYRPKVKFIRLDLNSDLVPKEGTEKTFGLKNFEFVWYPLK